MRDFLLDHVALLLLKHGFVVKGLTRPFDVLARKGGKVLLIKVLEDAASVTGETVEEMKKVASVIRAVPLMVSEKSREVLEENVVYARYGIDTINMETLKSVLSGKPVFLRSHRSGVSAVVDGERLKQAREQEGWSRASLSQKVGVSVRMVVEYEHQGAEVSVQRALRMYNAFGRGVFEQVAILSKREGDQVFPVVSPIGKKYERLGFVPAETKHQPFDIVARKDSEIILTRVGDTVRRDLEEVSSLLGSDSLVIFKKKKPKDVPALKKDEFLDLERAAELIKFVKEFV